MTKVDQHLRRHENSSDSSSSVRHLPADIRRRAATDNPLGIAVDCRPPERPASTSAGRHNLDLDAVGRTGRPAWTAVGRRNPDASAVDQTGHPAEIAAARVGRNSHNGHDDRHLRNRGDRTTFRPRGNASRRAATGADLRRRGEDPRNPDETAAGRTHRRIGDVVPTLDRLLRTHHVDPHERRHPNASIRAQRRVSYQHQPVAALHDLVLA